MRSAASDEDAHSDGTYFIQFDWFKGQPFSNRKQREAKAARARQSPGSNADEAGLDSKHARTTNVGEFCKSGGKYEFNGANYDSDENSVLKLIPQHYLDLSRQKLSSNLMND